MILIDCHTHLGNNEYIHYSVNQLLHSMDKAGIDKALVFAGDISDCSNEFLLKEISPYKDRLYGVAYAHLNKILSPEKKKKLLKKVIETGDIVAVKFYLGYDHIYPNDPQIYEAMNLIEEAKLTAIFHCGDCLSSIKNAKLKYAQPLLIDEVAVDFPNTNIVIAHVGFPWVIDTAEVCYKNKNVYTDVSGFVYGEFSQTSLIKFEKMISEFLEISSKNKLLFGSDAPISDQKSYVSACKYVSPCIFNENTKKVFGIK